MACSARMETGAVGDLYAQTAYSTSRASDPSRMAHTARRVDADRLDSSVMCSWRACVGRASQSGRIWHAGGAASRCVIGSAPVSASSLPSLRWKYQASRCVASVHQPCLNRRSACVSRRAVCEWSKESSSSLLRKVSKKKLQMI
jgi:hypothetical protein